MATLPTPGGDSGTWGTELNEFLLVSHKADGTLVDVVQNTQTASYQLVLTDSGKVVEMNVAGANNLTVPGNATVAFPVGTIIEICQLGAGQTTIVAGGATVLRSAGSNLKITSQYSSASLRKRATDEWVVTGALSA